MFRMLKWSAVPVAALVVAVSAAPAAAQVTATVVLKSGGRHTGQNPWTRVDKGEFTIRKSLHDELRVPASDVAYVDFGGTADTAVNLSGSQQAVVLRNGTVVKGQLIEMAHVTPNDQSSEYLVIFRDEQGQERRYPASQVGRVYFSGGATGTAGGSTGQPSEGSGVVVPANQRWTSTGLQVRRGERITFRSTGEIQLSTDASDVATPAGSKAQRYAPGAPFPRAFAGALIGRIGTGGQLLAIGETATLTMPAAGILYLGINDDTVADNRGEFRVEIQRTAMNRR